MPTDVLDEFDAPPDYNFEKIGSFGRFRTASTFPLDFVMTSFSPSETTKLTFAREIPATEDNLDFDLLMQRDIDIDRVNSEVQPYLTRAGSSSASRAVFFPPLLAAVVPVSEKRMLDRYPDETREVDANRLIRDWRGCFRIEHKITESASGYPLPPLPLEDETYRVLREPTRLRLQVHEYGWHGVKLVVIDGQHRLLAIRQLTERRSSLVQELVIPVCIVFPPNATEAQRKASGSVELPSVVDVFRDLFVDVNTNMRQVSGHFEILLSNETIGAVISRRFCQHITDKYGSKGLASIEWNVRSAKEAWTLTRPYSVASIGPLYLALEENLSQSANQSLLKSLLRLTEIEHLIRPPELGAPDDEEPDAEVAREYPPVGWAQFSLTQRPHIEAQISNHVIPAMDLIYFQTEHFKTKRDVLGSLLDSLLDNDAEDSVEALADKVAYNTIVNYAVPGTDEHRIRTNKFRDEVKVAQSGAGVAEITEYAIFHRGMWYAYFRLFRRGAVKGLTPEEIAFAFSHLLDTVLSSGGAVFQFNNSFVQHSIVNVGRIKPKKATRGAIADLIIAHLANKDVAKQFSTDAFSRRDASSSVDSLTTSLVQEGYDSASALLAYYANEYTKEFRKRYRVDGSLSDEQRDSLIAAEETQIESRRQLDAGEISANEYQQPFDNLVHEYVRQGVRRAALDLRAVIDVTTDLVPDDYSEDTEDAE